jgi:nicotinamide-nucleotide amidase
MSAGEMRIEVINTGTEIMLGNVLNSHLGYLSNAIFPLGLRVQRQATVPDGDAIRDALVETFGRADVVFVTGGLGPTTDDITREIVCELLGLTMQHDEEIWQAITARFNRRGIPWNERVKLQALHPAEARVLQNPNGTAPGLYFPPLPIPGTAQKSPHLFLLPGPPRELHPMVDNVVVPIIRDIAPETAAQELRSFRTTGLGESRVEEMVGEALLALGLEVGYCARPGEVDLRIIGAPSVLDLGEKIIREKLGASIFTTDTRPLESIVVAALRAAKQTLAIAESCTGGWISNKVTNIAGASEVFLAGYVTYANSAKTATLGVPAALIAANGAVSEPVARAMAEGARNSAGADIAIATTGIAGPGGGSPEKPVGTVFIAIAAKGTTTRVFQHLFPTDRETFKHLVAQTSLDLVRQHLG